MPVWNAIAVAADWLQRVALLGLLGWAHAGQAADDVVIYRCTDSQGAVSIQNMPCPKGVQQTRKVMQAVSAPPRSATPAAPPPPAAATAPVVPRLAPAPETPPPAPATTAPAAKPVLRPLPKLYQCQTREGASYLSETEGSTERCLSLQVAGLDGSVRRNAGEACEVVRDTCTEIQGPFACPAWRSHLEKAESAWRFAAPAEQTLMEREVARLREILLHSDCGAGQKP